MRTSKIHSRKKAFFEPRDLLSPRQAVFFVLEEAVLVLLMVYQVYNFLGIKASVGQASFFTSPVSTESVFLFALTIIVFALLYIVIALRDNYVWLIHKNFSYMLFGTAKLKIQFTTKKKLALLLFELGYTLIVAVSIFIYLDPDINVVPAPYNYIGFALLFVIGFFLFSQTKDFRTLVYGPTPVQKKLHFGRHEVKRFTNKKTGSIRLVPRSGYKNKRN